MNMMNISYDSKTKTNYVTRDYPCRNSHAFWVGMIVPTRQVIGSLPEEHSVIRALGSVGRCRALESIAPARSNKYLVADS